MIKEYWKKYHKQYRQKHKEKIYKKIKEWRKNNPERVKEINRQSRERNIERYKQISREHYKEWISIEQNRRHKKEYQKMWWKSRGSFVLQEKKERKELLKVLEKGNAVVNGYEVEVRQDKGGLWFYFLRQDKNLVYISDKFETKESLIKDLQYAI